MSLQFLVSAVFDPEFHVQFQALICPSSVINKKQNTLKVYCKCQIYSGKGY